MHCVQHHGMQAGIAIKLGRPPDAISEVCAILRTTPWFVGPLQGKRSQDYADQFSC